MAPDDAMRAAAAAILPWSEHDHASGFFHLSTADQVPETAMRHYAHHPRLVAMGFATAGLGTLLRFEPSRGGALFPHYYGWLPASAVAHRAIFVRDAAGIYSEHAP